MENGLVHRINKKLDYFKNELLPILSANEKTLAWVENVTNNSNVTQSSNNEISSNQAVFTESKWTGGDLNPRPLECKSSVHTS